MSVLDWHDDLAVGIAFIDDDHHEAVELINALAGAEGEERLTLFRRYLAHAEEHFAREEELMRQIGFFAYVPHSDEHRRVLDSLRAVLADLEAGLAVAPATTTTDLAEWLLAHRNSMDYVTAQFARAQGRT